MNNKNVLLIGGSGYIGTVITSHFLNLGYRVNVIDDGIEIKGKVTNKNGLQLINIFILELLESPFIKNKSVRLVEAKSTENSVENDNSMSFSISAELVKDVSKFNRTYFHQLGSIGIENRFKILKKEGLIK